jgi:hypothetical protein
MMGWSGWVANLTLASVPLNLMSEVWMAME